MASGTVTMVSVLSTGSRIAVIADMTVRIRRLYFSPGVARIECDPPELEGIAQKVKQEILGWIRERIGEEQLDFELQVSCRLPGKLPSLVKVDYSLAGAAVAVAILEGLFRREGITTSPRSDLAFSGGVEALSVQEVAGVGAARSDQQGSRPRTTKDAPGPLFDG